MAKHDKGRRRDSSEHKAPTVEVTAAPTPVEEKIGGKSAKGEMFRTLISPLLKRVLPAMGMSKDRIHLFMASLPEEKREFFKAGLKGAPLGFSFLFSKLPLHVFGGFENPHEAAETVARLVDEFLEEINDAVESYEGAEHVPTEVVDKAIDAVIAKAPRLKSAPVFRSPIELFQALDCRDPAKHSELKAWMKSLKPEEKDFFMRYVKYIDTLSELEGLLSFDRDERLEYVELLKNYNEKFLVSEYARDISGKVEGFLGTAKDKLKVLDRDVLRPAADDLSWSMQARSSVTTFGWILMLLSPLAAFVTWVFTKSTSSTGIALFGTSGLGLVSIIVGALLRKKRATDSTLSDGMNWLRLPFLAVGWAARWGTDEIGAIKRLISLAFTVPFLVVQVASLMNAPYVVFYTSLGSIIFAVFVLTVILVDTVLAFAAARFVGAITKKQDLFSGAAVTSIREWASSTVAWDVVIFMTFMLIPWVSPMAVGIIAASSLFFAAQRLAGWFHSKAGRYAAYGAIVVLLGLIVAREFSPKADSLAAEYAHEYLGGDIGLAGIEDRVLLRNLTDESREIRERAIAKCGQEYCSEADSLRDAEILRRRKELVKGTYWNVRNGTPIPPETASTLLSQEAAKMILGEAEGDDASK